ncbi:MAG: hypothetical protein RL641_656 [Candidatus Parcubacteria bacterium]|jgi:uncharacterized membrane protein YdjX (TVP38/TMEM64 family)
MNISTKLNELIKKIKTDQEFRNNFLKTVIISVLFYWLLFYIGSELKEANFITQAKVQHFVLHYGYFSWLAYVGLLVVTILSPLPDTPVVLAGGFIFGPYITIPLTIIGQLLGATADFYLARKLGRNFVTKKFPNATKALNEYSHSLGWQTVFLMRLTPTLSFDILSYAAGLSTIRFRPYIFATFFGMLPLVGVSAILGYSAGLHSKMLPFVIAAVGTVVITAIFFVFKKLNKVK